MFLVNFLSRNDTNKFTPLFEIIYSLEVNQFSIFDKPQLSDRIHSDNLFGGIRCCSCGVQNFENSPNRKRSSQSKFSSIGRGSTENSLPNSSVLCLCSISFGCDVSSILLTFVLRWGWKFKEPFQAIIVDTFFLIFCNYNRNYSTSIRKYDEGNVHRIYEFAVSFQLTVRSSKLLFIRVGIIALDRWIATNAWAW